MIDLKAPDAAARDNAEGNDALSASARAQDAGAQDTGAVITTPESTPEPANSASSTNAAPQIDDDETDAPRNADISGDGAFPAAELARITSDVIRNLKTVYDPEIPVDIYELGLIYKVDLADDRVLNVDMTLTAPGCPVAGEMPGWVEGALRGIDGVEDVKVDMVFEPPWTPERMSDEAKLELGWM